ncbi:MAG: hypothetical protein ABFQ95_06600, partial [Pseudomonadota bacterium]
LDRAQRVSIPKSCKYFCAFLAWATLAGFCSIATIPATLKSLEDGFSLNSTYIPNDGPPSYALQTTIGLVITSFLGPAAWNIQKKVSQVVKQITLRCGCCKTDDNDPEERSNSFNYTGRSWSKSEYPVYSIGTFTSLLLWGTMFFAIIMYAEANLDPNQWQPSDKILFTFLLGIPYLALIASVFTARSSDVNTGPLRRCSTQEPARSQRIALETIVTNARDEVRINGCSDTVEELARSMNLVFKLPASEETALINAEKSQSASPTNRPPNHSMFEIIKNLANQDPSIEKWRRIREKIALFITGARQVLSTPAMGIYSFYLGEQFAFLCGADPTVAQIIGGVNTVFLPLLLIKTWPVVQEDTDRFLDGFYRSRHSPNHWRQRGVSLLARGVAGATFVMPAAVFLRESILTQDLNISNKYAKDFLTAGFCLGPISAATSLFVEKQYTTISEFLARKLSKCRCCYYCCAPDDVDICVRVSRRLRKVQKRIIATNDPGAQRLYANFIAPPTQNSTESEEDDS